MGEKLSRNGTKSLPRMRAKVFKEKGQSRQGTGAKVVTERAQIVSDGHYSFGKGRKDVQDRAQSRPRTGARSYGNVRKVVPVQSQVFRERVQLVQEQAIVVREKEQVVPDREQVVQERAQVVPGRALVVRERAQDFEEVAPVVREGASRPGNSTVCPATNESSPESGKCPPE